MKEICCEKLKENKILYADVKVRMEYDFTSPELKTLVERYRLNQLIDCNDFDTVKNMLDWVSESVLHRGNYDNSDSQDAINLLEKAYKTQYGVNCLSLSIILCECLLAVGMRARVMYMMPENVEDTDNHVVVEVFLQEMKKWIMLDPTYGSYCMNRDKEPLNLYELRNATIGGEEILFSEKINYNGDQNLDLDDIKSYYVKNLFFLRCKKHQGYGVHREYGDMLEIAPIRFSVQERMVANLKYRINLFGPYDIFLKWLEYEENLENVYVDVDELYV